jgi:energy-coupling factor transport system ATP-binding protein
LNFSYDGVRPILHNIDFDVREGEMISIVGKNGAGKTTLSKIMCGFEKEDSGAVLYKGQTLLQSRSRTCRYSSEW